MPFAAVQRPRPLPVLVLADISGSMAVDGKTTSLNAAMGAMIRAFARERSARGEITVGVITFGGAGVALHHPLVPAAEASWADMSAVGGPAGTPMGEAFDLASEVLADGSAVPARAFAPTLVLVSDGAPTSEWKTQLNRLLASPQGSRSLRLAIAIGPETGSSAYRVLESFVDDPMYPVVRAEEAGRVTEIFRYLTQSMSVRVNSARPDDVSVFDPDDLHDLSD
ncbi:tellurite resistance protein TerY [Actinomadura bangladeshensis]|uniref:Tellurite resistance protein TerY n=2 Tax=Actinomadura bangladeshensis TaxID=453573 RepID=A0A4R4P0W1_9ACTN|nr:tellurite resistance protein TerY [Actinomadura bangladeshensis]